MPLSVSRSRSGSRTPHINDPTDLLLAEGALTEVTTELLHEFVHPHHHAEETLVEESEQCDEENLEGNRPWWRRPSPIWLLCIIPLTSMAMSATFAPKVELYTQLVCRVQKPEFFDQDHFHLLHALNTTTFLDHNAPKAANPCASDPIVQAAVAELSSVLAVSMGVLSCLTSAWWGAYSDRHGRTSIMGISVIGLLITDLNFIIVNSMVDRLPGGYWFLVVGPLIEGSLGGMTSAMGAIHAYLADTTTPATRSRTFSLNTGLLFTGMAIGPTLGGLLVKATQQPISVFYFTTIVHTIYAIIVWTVLPESLTKLQRQRSALKHKQDMIALSNPQNGGSMVGRLKRTFAFLAPLAVFLPDTIRDEDHNPLKKARRDWNLTCIAIAFGSAISLIATYPYKFQYAASTFQWTSTEIGYWISVVGAARAAYLTLILPLFIKLSKSRLFYGKHDSETAPLLGSTTPHHSPTFDLSLARISLMVEMVAYTFMGLATHVPMFTVFALIGSMGTGFSPAIQSVAVELYTHRGGHESGRLFGALSVVQALCSQIIGPTVYGTVYAKTVAGYPRTIFFVSTAMLGLALTMLTFVRIPQQVPTIVVEDIEEQERWEFEREGTLVGASDTMATNATK